MNRRGFNFALGAGALGVFNIGTAWAQQTPALATASPAERERLAPLIEGARREGRMTYWDTVIQPETHDELQAAFRRHYGLPNAFRVNYTLTGTGALVTRIEQELAADRVTIDVAAIASPTWVFEKLAAGHIARYASPELAQYGRVFEAGLGEKDVFAFNGAYVFVPMWNAERLNFTGKSWLDVINAVPQGRISIGDSAVSASYLATYIGQTKALPARFFTDLAAMKPAFLLRSEQVAQRLVTGQDLMAFSGMPTRAFQNNAQGAKLRFIMPEEGVVLMAQCSFVLQKAPSPNAARLWTDFIHSEAGQQILARREALISGRSGFRSPLPEYAPAIDQLKLLDVDWRGMTTADLQKHREDWTRIFKS
jgi:iron(III) transport system substrate-binding protein